MFDSYGDILTVDEVAEALKIGTSQAYRILRTGELKGYKEGKDWKTPQIALESYIRRKVNMPTQL